MTRFLPAHLEPWCSGKASASFDTLKRGIPFGQAGHQ
jgi:hypothetical protein